VKNLFVFISVVAIVMITADVSHSTQYWAKTYWGNESDLAYSVQQTTDGGYIVAGYTRSFGAGDYDAWILKLDQDGAVTWQKTYGGSDRDYVYSIQQTTDGGYIVGGSTYSFGAGLSDFWILKLDPSGTVTWQKTYSSYNDWGVRSDSANSIQQTADGGYMVAGSSNDQDEFGDDYDFWILKLDANGDITWQKRYLWYDWIFTHSIQQTLDGGYIVTGELWNFYLQPNPPNRFDSDIFVLKLNNSGDIIWNKFYDNGSWEYASSIQQTSDGGFIVAGGTEDSDAATTWIFKLASNGDISWQKNYAGSGFYYTTSIHQTDDDGDSVRDDGYIVVGSTDDDHDILVLKLNSSGHIMWQKTYGGSNNERAESIIQTSDGGYVIGGVTGTYGANNAGMLILKISSNGNIPGCDIIETSDAIASDILVEGQDGGPSIHSPLVTVTETTVVPQDSSAKISFVCCYDTDDYDEDGLGNACDICPSNYDPEQEDTYPPGGNGIGDACDCECDFDCSGSVDADDVTSFLADFGRSEFNDPCTNADPCDGDVDCNGTCDADDVTVFLEDFGRSSFFNPCPPCVAGDWCEYTTSSSSTTTVPSPQEKKRRSLDKVGIQAEKLDIP
jgi:hypothetical protein